VPLAVTLLVRCCIAAVTRRSAEIP
jgi:hypothetical protein